MRIYENSYARSKTNEKIMPLPGIGYGDPPKEVIAVTSPPKVPQQMRAGV
jgi:hypothetical protein